MATTKTATKISTRELLLDVAEELFTIHGFDGTSVRNITDQAGTRLASINYHFGTKKSLFIAVIMRRAIVLSEERLEMLSNLHCEKLQTENALSELVACFVSPLLKHSTKGDPGWKNYCRLIAQTATFKRANEDPTVREVFDPPALEFVKVFKQIFPLNTDQQVHYAFQFMLGTTLYVFTENLRIDTMTDGKMHSSELNNIYPHLLKYICGGIMTMSTFT